VMGWAVSSISAMAETARARACRTIELKRQNFGIPPKCTVHVRWLLGETGQQRILQLCPRVDVDLLPETTIPG
jgi:hypothetical protein